jgi:hypothetical protein
MGARRPGKILSVPASAVTPRKGSRTPEQARMHLIQKPVKPKPRTFLHLQISRVPHDSWKTFLDVAYWNVELSD